MKDDSVRAKAMERLLERGLRTDLKPGSSSCLDTEILAAYIDRTLSQRERADCEGHLASCARCQEHVAALVRLSEAEEPVQVRATTTAPARAIRPSWFRLYLAGPAFAALLVAGVYFVGPFRDIIQQGPEINRPTRPAVEPSSPQPEANDQAKTQPSSPAKRNEGATGDKKSLEDKTRSLTLAEKKAPTQPPTTPTEREGGRTATSQRAVAQNPESAPPSPQQSSSITTQGQVISRNTAPPEPTTSDHSLAVRSRAIAPPSVRAKIAQNGPREGGATSGGSGAGTAVGGVAGGVVGGLSNNLSRKNSKDEDKVRPPQRQGDATATIAKEEADVAKTRTQNEAKAKADSTPSDATTTEHRDREERKQGVTPAAVVNPANRSAQAEFMVLGPAWRVGPHGLLEQREANGHWKKHKSGVTTDLNDISFGTPDVGWAVGQAGTVLRSTDGGKVWIQLPSPTTQDIVHVTAIGDSAANIVTRSGGTLTTADGGKTWSGESQ